MADDRRIFPVEKVLELVAGKEDADVKEIAAFVTGAPVLDDAACKAAAPFASAWLGRWYPRFMDLDWKEDGNWNDFVKQAKARLGDNISLTPMSGRLKVLAAQTLEAIAQARDSLNRQLDAGMKLEEKAKSVEPLENALKDAQKKNDELEAKLKSMKADMGALQRKVAEFNGKMPIAHDELMQNIKDAIKDGLKGLAIGNTVADTVQAAAEAESIHATPPDDFGFGSSGPDADGFGF